MSKYVIPTDKLLLGGHLALGTSVSIETSNNQHGIDFPDEIKFVKSSIHQAGLQTDTIKSAGGTNLLAFENSRLVFKVPTTLTNIDLEGLTTASVASQNYANQTLEHELDALTTAQNTILGRTQGLTTSRIMKSNGSGILAVSSITEGNVNTLSGNETVSGNKTHSGDITINDLTASKLVLTDGSKKLVSGLGEADLFRLGVASNQFQGESGVATIYSQTQSSNASDSINFIRMTQGTSSPKEMGLKMVGATQSLNFTDTLNLLDLGDGDDGTTIGQIKNNGINIISGKTYQINGSQIASANLSDTANIVKLDTSENNFTGIVDASSFKQGNSALNFSHLAGATADNQLSSNIPLLDATENNFTGIVDGASFKQGNSALNFSHLAGSLNFSALAGSCADSQLSSNVPLKDADIFQSKAGAITNTMRTVSDTTGDNSKLTLSKILANGNAVYDNYISAYNSGQMIFQTSTANGFRWNIDGATQYLKLSKTTLDLKAGMLITIGGTQIDSDDLSNKDALFHDDDDFIATGQCSFTNRLTVGTGDDGATSNRGVYYGLHTFNHGIKLVGETNVSTSGNLNILSGSKLKLKNGSDLEVESGADLIVKSGGDILLDSGAVLTNNGTTALAGTSAITANMTISNNADFITSSGSQTTINSGGILELLDGAITKLGTNSITKINNALPSVNSSIAYDTAGKPSFVKLFQGEQYLRGVFPASLIATNQPCRMRYDVIPIENDSSVISSLYRQSVTVDTHNSLSPFADDGSARDERHQIAPTYNITRDGTFASSSLISECNLVFNDGHISGSNDHKSIFIKGCGYINWGHSGWGSAIQGATNKFVRLGVKCSETVRVVADGKLVGTVNRTGGDNHQGVGSDAPSTFHYHMFPAKGDYTTIEVVVFNYTNSLVLDLEVYPISYWNDP